MGRQRYWSTVPFKFSASKHLWVQAAVTLPHGKVQIGGLIRPDLYFGKEFGKAESSNATHAWDDDQTQAHKYFW